MHKYDKNKIFVKLKVAYHVAGVYNDKKKENLFKVFHQSLVPTNLALFDDDNHFQSAENPFLYTVPCFFRSTWRLQSFFLITSNMSVFLKKGLPSRVSDK
jgi:hypothetical protein